MPVLPFSRNIGPGNVPNPVTENWVDGAAYEHDIAYGKAENPEHIRTADREFLSKLTNQFDSNPLHTIHQLFGGIGIGAKYAAESVFGVQYPRFMDGEADGEQEVLPSQIEKPDSTTGKRKSGGKGKGGKKAKADGTSSSAAAAPLGSLGSVSSTGANNTASRTKMEGAVGPEASSAAPHAGAASALNMLSHPCNNITPASPFHVCKEFNLELVTFNPTFTTKSGTQPIGVWPAPLYSFAIERFGWYWNRGEINWLNALNGCSQTIRRIKGSITLGVLNSPFVTQTASSNQTSANTNVNVVLYTGQGLEDHMCVLNGLGTLDYSTTSGDFPLTAWQSGLFDTAKLHEFDFTTAPPALPATIVTRKYNQLAGFPTQVTATTSANVKSNCLAPPTYPGKMEKIIESTAGGELLSWDYSPNCPFSLQNTIAHQLDGGVAVGANVQPISDLTTALILGPGTCPMSNEDRNEAAININSAIYNNNHYAFGGHGFDPKMSSPPTLLPRQYIGFLPPTTVGGTAVQPIKIQIQIKTEAWIEASMDTTYSTNACIKPHQSELAWPTAESGYMRRFNGFSNSSFTNTWAGLPNLSVNYT